MRIVYFDALPLHGTRFNHGDADLGYGFSTETADQVRAEAIVCQCAALARTWSVVIIWGLNGNFNTETFTLLHPVDESRNAANHLFD